MAEEAWQKAVGLINFTRGPAGHARADHRPAGAHGDTKFTAAYFSTVGQAEKQGLDVRFNFRPALAMLGDYLVLSSTESLARDLIDALKRESSSRVEPLAGADSLIDIDGVDLATLLARTASA